MITDKDRAFARELVQLARKHGAGKLSVDFTLQSSRNFQDLNPDGSLTRYEDVKMHWEEGRHGAKTTIHLSASVFVRMTEEMPPLVEVGDHP